MAARRWTGRPRPDLPLFEGLPEADRRKLLIARLPTVEKLNRPQGRPAPHAIARCGPPCRQPRDAGGAGAGGAVPGAVLLPGGRPPAGVSAAEGEVRRPAARARTHPTPPRPTDQEGWAHPSPSCRGDVRVRCGRWRTSPWGPRRPRSGWCLRRSRSRTSSWTSAWHCGSSCCRSIAPPPLHSFIFFSPDTAGCFHSCNSV